MRILIQLFHFLLDIFECRIFRIVLFLLLTLIIGSEPLRIDRKTFPPPPLAMMRGSSELSSHHLQTLPSQDIRHASIDLVSVLWMPTYPLPASTNRSRLKLGTSHLSNLFLMKYQTKVAVRVPPAPIAIPSARLDIAMEVGIGLSIIALSPSRNSSRFLYVNCIFDNCSTRTGKRALLILRDMTNSE